ncbi:MAG: DUF4339 domain-containing protein [Planctomycetota bacterium]
MGIRFFCPNGHKLHVKAFLAGKRGYCPKCGTKLLIPEASATSLAKDRPTPGTQDQAASQPQSANLLPRRMESRRTTTGTHRAHDSSTRFTSETVPQNGSGSMAPLEEMAPVEEALANEARGGGGLQDIVPQDGDIVPQDGVEELEQHEPGLQRSEQTSQQAEPQEAVSVQQEPLSEAVWYVRPPSGGQYGPATRHEIDRWSAEGRIPHESLVWREGWEDWRSAGDALFGTSSGDEQNRDAWPVASDISTEAAGPSYVRQKKKKQTTLVAALSVACVILLIVFLFVVQPWNTG